MAQARPNRTLLLACVLGSLASLVANAALAAEYYVATNGNDSNPGTLAQPFATLKKGHDAAVAGDTVYIRGGTYRITTPATSGAGIVITKSGTSDTNRIRFWAYNGEVPIFDFSQMVISTTGYTSGFAVSGSWLHFKGLEICNVPMNTRSNTGMGVNDPAHDDIFELMNFHHNHGAGFFISHGTGGHLILNSDSHDNYDPTSSQGDGENADGFGVHYQETGATTVFRGCRAWWNSDDGWDFISQEVPVLVENCWAFGGGYINSGTGTAGNGNGFKAGSSKTGIRHTIRNCVAWKNRASGFYANHSSGGNTWYNNTSYSNGTQYNMLASTWDSAGNRTDGVVLTGSKAHVMRNNIGFPLDNTYMDGVDSAFNTWDLKITPTANDFASISETGLLGPRQADGSLPNLDFMKLRSGSQMIDKGTNVQLPYVGQAPDLGAYEFGATAGGRTSVGSGGATAGGVVGSGGTVAGGTTSSGGRAAGGAAATGGTTRISGGAGGAIVVAGGGPGSGGRASNGGGANTNGGSTGAVTTGGANPMSSGGAAASPSTGSGTGGAVTGTGSSIAVGGASTVGGRGAAVSGGTATTNRSAGGSSANATAGGQSAMTNGALSAEESGCSCVVGPRSPRHSYSALLAVLGGLGLVARGRRKRASVRVG